MKTRLFKSGLIILFSVALAGCTVIFQTGRRSDVDRIRALSAELEELNNAKALLENALSKEIADKTVKLEMMEKGLVITVVGDVLFDSGKSKIRTQSYTILNKVATVLNENVPELKVGIEGHTDDQPIRHSGWKSNWELSTARALSVLHYLVEQKSVSPERISAIGYGEFRPVASNGAKEGRQLNRRVEIVILPQFVKSAEEKKEKKEEIKSTEEVGEAEVGLKEPKENLK